MAPIFWGALSLFGGLLVASRTRSAYIALLSFLVIGFTQGRGLRVRQLIVPLVALAFGVFVMDAMTSTTEFLVRDPESIRTMSDRIPLWQHLTSTVMREAPLTGLGYYAASRVYAPEYNPGLGNAHSVFFEVLVGGGILGAALYLVLCGFVGLVCRAPAVARQRATERRCCGWTALRRPTHRNHNASRLCTPGHWASPSGRRRRFFRVFCVKAARARIAGDQRPHARKSSLRAGTVVSTS